MPKGIENGEFKLYYQPIIDVKTLSIIGMEALVRWNHPVLGMISPEKFIPIAEENGFIVTLGEWVLKTACRQNKAWQNAGFKKIFVSVNISLRQFQNKNFVKMIKDILNETSFDSKYLGLEITESIAMENEDYTIEVLRELKDMGLYLAIDDFGTGYSSLGYLNKFPIDTLKIDKSFIKTLMDEKENSAPIASSIIALGHNLNLKITAEGVETMDQFKYLKKQNCDAIQGYLFSKPLTSDEFEDLLGLPKLTVQPEYS
jgi:EAL domain-containing protein (putative c-di-GMP-specific phosphodiesterase class I)